MDGASWLGRWHWAHDGREINGHIELTERDGQRLLVTSFAHGTAGTWWPTFSGRSVEVEWRRSRGDLVRHTLEAVGNAEIVEFVVVKKQLGEPLRDHRGLLKTRGWRQGGPCGRVLVGSALSPKLYNAEERPARSGMYASPCPVCRRPLELTITEAGLKMTSPLEVKRYDAAGLHGHYSCHCPNCRRPVEVDEVQGLSFHHLPSVGTWLQPLLKQPEIQSKCAYVSVLYGNSVEYVRDARVLGFSLRSSGTPHDLVLLHTNELSKEHLQMLAGLWTLRSVEYIHGAKTLFKPTTRFHGVFTKLQAWTLTEYERVLFLDLDLLVKRNVDDLFQLRPPAAMWAKGGQKHGELIDAPPPFKGYHPVEPWGKAGCVGGLSVTRALPVRLGCQRRLMLNLRSMLG